MEALVIRSKSQNYSFAQNIWLGQTFLAAQFFPFIDILLKPNR